MTKMLLALSTLGILFAVAFALPLDEHEKLLTAHIKNYTTANSPSPGMHNKTVYCILDLYQILSVEEKSNILNAKIWMYCYYVLPAMSWDPADYGGIRMMVFKKDTFWTPDIEVNSMTSNEYQSSTAQYVNSEGLVLPIATSINAKLSCKFDVTDFPHDEHLCILQVRQWLYEIEDYRIRYPSEVSGGKSQMMLQNYVKHDQWELIEPVEMEVGFAKFLGEDVYDQHNYKIRIRRSPDFFLRVLIYPTLVIYIISTLSFYLPFESGEKVSLSITILLAQIVNLLVLSDSIPASSVNFPAFGKFVLFNIVFVGFTVLVSVITLNMYYKSTSSSPPRFLRRLLYTRIAWLVGATRLPGTCDVSSNTAKVEPNQDDIKKSAPMNDPIFEKVSKIEEMVCGPDKDEQIKQEWQMIALIIDRFCGCIYILAGIAGTIFYNPLQF